MSGRCPACGALMPEGVLEGHCPACLSRVSLEWNDRSETDEFSDGGFSRRFGDYEVLAEVARGGMGVVYRARQISLKREVALKMVLASHFAGRAALERFRSEAQAAASLQHPGIVAIHEVGEAEGQPYFTMEFIEGRDLADVVRRGPLPPKPAARYVEQIARAIDYAHQNGVLHRDLKPANVLIDKFDHPRITDFGLAKQFSTSASSLTGQSSLTRTGQALGSPSYMAPEQTSAKHGEVGVGTDIYSLGALLYHLITGRPPFAAGTVAETVHQVLYHEPARPRVINPSLPQDLETICLKCLEKEPTRRYATAAAVAEELGRFLHDEPILARPISPLQRTWRWCRRNRAVAALGMLAGLLGLAVCLALMAVVVDNMRIRQEQSQKDAALRQKAAALEAARESEHQAREDLFQSLRNQARARRFSRQPGQRLESLAAAFEAARIRSDGSLRDEAIAAMALPDVARGPSWSGYGPGVRAIAFDGSYQRYARLNEQGEISIRSVPDDHQIQLLPAPSTNFSWQGNSCMLFSTDSRWLAVVDCLAGVRLWWLADGLVKLEPRLARPLVAAFSPDSRQFVVATEDAIVLFDLLTGSEHKRWGLRTKPFSIRFDPSNRRLAVGYLDSDVVSIFDSVTGTEMASLSVGSSSEEVVAWHPDGIHLAAAGSDPRIQIWDVDLGRLQARLQGHVQQVTGLSFDPEGALLASQSWEGVVRLWEPQSARQVMLIPYGPAVRISDDGKWLGFGLSAPAKLQLWSLTSAREYVSFGPGVGYDGQLSPDGHLVALITEKGIGLWKLANRTELAFRTVEDVRSVVFSPDQRELLVCGPGAGLQRWPLHASGQDAVEFGQSTQIRLPWTPMRAAIDPEGHMAAIISQAAGQAVLLDLSSNQFVGESLPHTMGCLAAYSPDGRWLASAGWHASVVRLWDVRSQRLVHEWPVHGPSQVVFTPDSRRLVISQPGEFSFWDVDTRKATLQLQHEVLFPGHVAFSPDQKLMALEMAPGIIHLKESSTGRTVARLEDPFGDRSTWMAFTLDGCRLVTTGRYAKIAHLWDLSMIRTELRAMELDWDWPPLPASADSSLHPSDVASQKPVSTPSLQ